MTNQIYNKLEEIGLDRLVQMTEDDYLDTWEFICKEFFNLD